MRILLLIFALAPLFGARAQDMIIEVQPPDGRAAPGACDQPLPVEQSRRATAATLVCGGARVDLPIRTAIKSPYYEDWSRLDRGNSRLNENTRREMQAVRLKEDPIAYAAQAKFKTYETWTWYTRLRGANRAHCPVHVESYSCMKMQPDYNRPIIRRRCHEEPDENLAVVPGVGRRHKKDCDEDDDEDCEESHAHGTLPVPTPWHNDRPQRRARTPDLGNLPGRMENADSFNRRWQKQDREFGSRGRTNSPPPSRPSPPPSRSGGSDRGSGTGSNGGSRRRSFLEGVIVSPAEAKEVCENVQEGYEETLQPAMCKREIVDTCEWEEPHTEVRECPEGTLNVNVAYNKPDATWAPGQPGYHDLLPNKYDLLPGETETLTFLTNKGQVSEIAGRGRSERIVPLLDIENPWNEYQVKYLDESGRDVRAGLRCDYRQPLTVNTQIATVKRIVRRAPNALVKAKNKQGQDAEFDVDVYYFGDGSKGARLKPTRIMLQDTSNETMLTAARQSRKFEGMDTFTTVTEVAGAQKSATAADLGFWKNTFIKVKLIEKSTCWGVPDKVFSDTLDTTSQMTASSEDRLVIPLDGSRMGVPSFYSPNGVVGHMLERVFGHIDLDFAPGHEYEFRVQMLQRGLPFYENGCLDGSTTCDEKGTNQKMFSDELVLNFIADPRVDRRGWLQWYEEFHRRPFWATLNNCGKK